ncbi:Iron-sulfur cluster assembly accessory protein [Gammaproteobacteria bacterium]
MIHLTEEAANQIQQAAASSGIVDLALRLAVRKTPEGLLDYGMGFDDPTPNDSQLEVRGVKIVIAPQFTEILQDLTLDYVEIEPGDFRFIFQNPNDPQHGAKTPAKK